MDRRLRELERSYEGTGDPVDGDRLLREHRRAGSLIAALARRVASLERAVEVLTRVPQLAPGPLRHFLVSEARRRPLEEAELLEVLAPVGAGVGRPCPRCRLGALLWSPYRVRPGGLISCLVCGGRHGDTPDLDLFPARRSRASRTCATRRPSTGSSATSASTANSSWSGSAGRGCSCPSSPSARSWRGPSSSRTTRRPGRRRRPSATWRGPSTRSGPGGHPDADGDHRTEPLAALATGEHRGASVVCIAPRPLRSRVLAKARTMQISLDPSARELMNADLEQLYDQHYRSLASLRATHPGLSHPLLLRVPEGYARAPVRLLVLGQETNGWASGLADVTGNEMVRRLLSHYEEFRLGLGYRKGQFWRAVRSLEARLGVEPGKVVWGNLNRCDLGRKSPPGSLAQDLMRAFPVLSAEVTITRPGVVVFFTGPRFDDHIRWAWPGADFQQLAGGLPARQLARVVHPLLPRNSFRTYHPKFLSMAKSSEEVLGLIAAHAGV